MFQFSSDLFRFKNVDKDVINVMVKLSSLSFTSACETNDQSPQTKELQSDLEADLKVTFSFVILTKLILYYPN